MLNQPQDLRSTSTMELVLVTILFVLAAIAMGFAILKIGISILRILSTPLPEPPPAGELRKVKLNYLCSLCGSEGRMTVATAENPDPP